MKKPVHFIFSKLLLFILSTIQFSCCITSESLDVKLVNLNCIQTTNQGKIYVIDNKKKVLIYDQYTLGQKLLIEDRWEKNFNSILFTDSLKGFIAGRKGKITQTNDGGKTWSTINFNNRSNFKKVYFFNERIGYLIGEHGSIYKTNCGGSEWMKQEIPYKIDLYGITFTDSLTGYVVGSKGKILKTTDGGKVWKLNKFNYKHTLNDIKFLNPNEGYIAGNYGIILKTKDSGANWIRINTEHEIPNHLINNTSYYEINFLGNEAYIKGKANILVKINKDNTCKFIHSIPDCYLTALNMIGNSYSTAYGIKDFRLPLYFDTLKWIRKDLPSKKCMNDLYFISKDTGFVVGARGTILKTEDGGDHWNFINSGTKKGLTSVQFINDRIGYILGYNGIFLKTIDGGNTWEKKQLSKNIPFFLNKSYFINADTGYAVGSIGIKFKTTDGGNSWNQIAPESKFNGHLSSVYFINSEIGFAVGRGRGHSVIQRTINGGKTWETKNYESFSDFRIIKFIDDKIGYIVGSYNWKDKILKTTDGGKKWKSKYLNVYSSISSIFILDKNTGYALNQFSGKMWKFDPMEEF